MNKILKSLANLINRKENLLKINIRKKKQDISTDVEEWKTRKHYAHIYSNISENLDELIIF